MQHYLEELSRRKLPEIAKLCHVSPSDVQNAAEAIARLEPRPGRPFSSEEEQTILPDVIVERDGDDYTLSLNDDERFLRYDLAIVTRICFRNPLLTARCGLLTRKDSAAGGALSAVPATPAHALLNISREIVVRQRDFFLIWVRPICGP